MSNNNTNKQFLEIGNKCEELFLLKTKDYGTAWRVMRSVSIVDQLHIKLQRIRTIQENLDQKIKDTIQDELIGIVNYSIIGLIQLALIDDDEMDLSFEKTKKLYHYRFQKAYDLMVLKNQDYGEAWRNISKQGFVDLMLMKIYRMRQLIQNKDQTIISEGIDANFLDLINYAIFAQIMYYYE